MNHCAVSRVERKSTLTLMITNLNPNPKLHAVSGDGNLAIHDPFSRLMASLRNETPEQRPPPFCTFSPLAEGRPREPSEAA